MEKITLSCTSLEELMDNPDTRNKSERERVDKAKEAYEAKHGIQNALVRLYYNGQHVVAEIGHSTMDENKVDWSLTRI